MVVEIIVIIEIIVVIEIIEIIGMMIKIFLTDDICRFLGRSLQL
jgi:hypothetical protein